MCFLSCSRLFLFNKTSALPVKGYIICLLPLSSNWLYRATPAETPALGICVLIWSRLLRQARGTEEIHIRTLIPMGLNKVSRGNSGQNESSVTLACRTRRLSVAVLWNETDKTEVPCHSSCGTIKIPPFTKPRGRLFMNERFSNNWNTICKRSNNMNKIT